ncbi:hypothetical protein [uncultured Imperialibacter sp.]|uniref:hypothetical protein n=2 Tax=Cytophagales TaxID=768507 RepID=UPI0030DD4144|tara:strand:+ start:266 stop:628 length:363 start_codon:yes stop_codon:yes gene_type:complete
MKTFKLTIAMLLISAVWSYAQTIPMTMFEKIENNQVPAAVLKTFETEFGQVKNDIQKGAWYAHFEHTVDKPADQGTAGTSRAIPLHYSYIGKMDGRKVEIKFTPEGKLATTKGLEEKTSN